ncbi:MAG: hypothetical protein QOF62_2567 [Pyrinomonadaceae bacterium]|jgi:hypothetical protein|nr:hypothetical protein [Pyrinomonadaceae bacterium]
MPKAKGKRTQTIDFNEYLARVMSLKGDALKKWNRESIRRSRLLQKEFLESGRSNIEEYLQTPRAQESLAEQGKHAGEVTLKWEIDMEPGECRLRVSVGDASSDLGLVAGHPVLDRITAKRFISLINQHLIAASSSLFEASAIYSSERVQKSNPRHWRSRFMTEQVQRLEKLTGKPKKFGRPANTRKSCLQIEDETKQLKADVILAVQNLYRGKSDSTYYCPKHEHGVCPGHDFEEIDIANVAGYLNRSGGTLRNQLSKTKLKFPNLKKEALVNVTN